MIPDRLKRWWRINVAPRKLKTRTVRHFIPYHDLQKGIHYWPGVLPPGLKRSTMLAALHHTYSNMCKIPSATRGYSRQMEYTSLALSLYREGGPYPENLATEETGTQLHAREYVPSSKDRHILSDLILSIGAAYFSKVPKEGVETEYQCYSTVPAPGWQASWAKGLAWIHTDHNFRRQRAVPSAGVLLSWTEYSIDGKACHITDIVKDAIDRMRALGAEEVTIAKFETALMLSSVQPGKNYDTWLEDYAKRAMKVYGR